MRPIKFRAWDGTKMWYPSDAYGIQLRFSKVATELLFADPDETHEPAIVATDSEMTLMQFTGLHDKNGKEIWEGDILSYRGEPVVVEYFGDMFHCRSTKYPNLTPGNYRLMTLKDTCEVLGNIYENPEILSA